MMLLQLSRLVLPSDSQVVPTLAVDDSTISHYFRTTARTFLTCLFIVVAVLAGGGGAVAAPLRYQVLPSSDPAAPAPPSGTLASNVVPGGIDGGFRAETGTVTVTSLRAARDAIRAATGRTAVGQTVVPSNWEGAIVTLLEGTHYQSETFTLDSRDSGTATAPVIFRAAEGANVVVSGAYPVPPAAWSPVSSSDIFAWSRIDPAYRAACYKVNVASLGIDRGTMGGGWGDVENRLMLLINGELRGLSRYPAAPSTAAEHTAGAWLNMSSVTGGGSYAAACSVALGDAVPGAWDETNQDILVYGTWGLSWPIMWEKVTSLTNASGTTFTFNRNGVATPTPTGHYIAFANQLNVIGKGEYCWNHTNGMLYYRPRDGEAAPTEPVLKTSLSHLPTVLQLGADGISESAANHVEFSGISFEGTRRATVQVFGSTGNRFVDCEVRSSGGQGWEVEGVRNFTIDGGSSHHLAQIAGTLQSGDKNTLTRGNLLVTGHDVYEIGRYLHQNTSWAFSLRSRDGTFSCGIRFTNCDFYDLRDGAIIANGADVEIDHCTFTRTNLITGDQGAVNTGGSPLGPWAYAFTNAGVHIHHNTFTDITRHPLGPASHAALYACYMESAAYLTVEDNFFNNCDHAFNIPACKNTIIRRNKFTNCHLGHHGVPIVVGGRLTYTSNRRDLEGDLTQHNVSSGAFASEFPRLKDWLGYSYVTATASDDVITNRTSGGAALAHGITDGTALYRLDKGSGFGGIAEETVVYARDVTSTTFKVAATPGGAAINITSDGTGGAFGRPENSVMLYPVNVIIVDNMTTTGSLLARLGTSGTGAVSSSTLTGPYNQTIGTMTFSVGVDTSQRNYPPGASGTPVQGGGTVALGTIDRQ